MRMNTQPLFLRLGIVLPQGCDLLGQERFGGWTSSDPPGAHEVDARVRAVGWHFMWLTLFSSRTRIGLTSGTAISKAKLAALSDLNVRFNAAELISAKVRKYLGFYVAKVKLASRHIQECASLGLVDEAIFRQSPDRTGTPARQPT